MTNRQKLFLAVFFPLSLLLPALAFFYLGPWSSTAGEVLIAGTAYDDKIEVFCNYEDSHGLEKYKTLVHWVFLTTDQNGDGRFDDEQRTVLVGFDKNHEVTLEAYAGDDEVHVFCHKDDLAHWLVINAGPGDDKVYGSEASEWIFGDLGVDVLFGNCRGDCEHQRTCVGKTIASEEKSFQRRFEILSLIPKPSSISRDFIVPSSDFEKSTLHWDKISNLVGEAETSKGHFEEVYCGQNDRCAVIGSEEGDCIRGAINGETLVYSRGGNDDIQTFAGDDLVHAGAGDDVIRLGPGRDQAFGDLGADQIHGEEGPDLVAGGKGQDLIWGGADDDSLCGDYDSDQMWGGEGRDRASQDDQDKYLEIEQVKSFYCFPKKPVQKGSKNLQAVGIQPHQIRDWIGLPRFRMVGLRKIPKSFADERQFDLAMGELKTILREYKVSDGSIVIFGSAVNGVAELGKPFRYAGPDASDLDIEIQSREILEPLRDKWINQEGGILNRDFDDFYPKIPAWSEKWGGILKRKIQTYGKLPSKRYWQSMIVVSLP